MKGVVLVLIIFAVAALGYYFWRAHDGGLSANVALNLTQNPAAGTATATFESGAPAAAPPARLAPQIEILNQPVSQGGTLYVSFAGGAPDSAEFNGKPMHLFEFQGEERAVYPISDIFPPGDYGITADFRDGSAAQKQVQVLKYDFPVVRMEQPGGRPSPETEAELEAQALDFKAIFERPEAAAEFAKTFVLPLRIPLRVASPYGEVRQYPDGSATRHLGVDFSAPVGTPVYAVNGGTVVKVTDYLSYGNTVVIDHGAGIYSIYLHLSRVFAAAGQKVARGGEIGLTGATGFVTGPHLHLSIKIGDVSVDPMRFVNTLNSVE